ncbi:hypothetical protein Tco_1106020 [Tanacetum coccineum]
MREVSSSSLSVGVFPSRWESVGFCPVDASVRGWQGLPSGDYLLVEEFMNVVVVELAGYWFKWLDEMWVFALNWVIEYGNEKLRIEHRHNIVRDTLVDICFRLGISAGKEVDIGLESSPLTQNGMVEFVPGRVVIDATHRKRV